MYYKKENKRKVSIILFLITIFIPVHEVCSAPNFDELLSQSVFKSGFEKQLINAKFENIEFFITNSTYILDILRQTDLIYFASIFPRISEYDVDGNPDKFRVTSPISTLDVEMYNVAPGKFIFVGLGENRRFKFPIKGKLFAAIEINKINGSDDHCTINLKLGFKPSSKVMSMAMKPIAQLFTAQMNKLSRMLRFASEKYVSTMEKVLPTHLDNKNIISQVSILHRENNSMRDHILQLETIKQKLQILNEPSKKDKQFNLLPQNWLASLIYLVIGLIIGGWGMRLFQKYKKCVA